MLTAPAWVSRFYSKFPLVALDPDDPVDWEAGVPAGQGEKCILWVQPHQPSEAGDDKFTWASSSPPSLHAQLLLLLRGVPVSMRPWYNEASAPGETLPTLHLTSKNKLVSHNDIRSWLDNTHPLVKNVKYHGMPDQGAYDDAVALAKFVLGQIKPALLATSTHGPHANTALLSSEPPALLAGLSTPLPASLTGDDRDLDEASVLQRGLEALSVLARKVDESRWAIGAEQPSPLDALITSHVYCIYSLPAESTLRQRLESLPELEAYVARVMDIAGEQLSSRH